MRGHDGAWGVRPIAVGLVWVVLGGAGAARSVGRCVAMGWQPGLPGMDGAVWALTVYNGDLVTGGFFTTAGSAPCNYIARWDGTQWQSLGSGMGGIQYPRVYALAVYNSALIAGGDFTTAGGAACSRIARWDGAGWQDVGGGTDWAVQALTVYNGDLIAGGYFDTAGGVPCSRIARWNGVQWQPLGSGIDGLVVALTVYNGDLIAGGNFATAGGVPCNGIARWDGTAWHALGSGMGGGELYTSLWALETYDADLIAGGRFTTAGSVPCNYIARWDGTSWHGMDGGMLASVRALTIYDGDLVAGGEFEAAGGVPCNYIARWDGAAWEPLGTGMNSSVHALMIYDGEMIAGGRFTAAGGYASAYWARWGCLTEAPGMVFSEPPADGTLPKTQNNVIVLTFESAITLPAGPALSIVNLHTGTDVGASFMFTLQTTVVADDTLKAKENGAVLVNRNWYRVTPGAGFGVAPFTLDVCTLQGDPDGNGKTAASDNAAIKPHLFEVTDARYDLDGSGRVLAQDYFVVKSRLFDTKPPKP